MKKIIFVGDLNKYTRTYQRYRTLRELGHEVKGISSVSLGRISGIKEDPGLIERFFSKLGYPLDVTGANRKLLQAVRGEKPDIIWDEKALTLRPRILKKVKDKFPKIILIFYSEDDMYQKHNQSRYFVKSIPLFDAIFTTKSYNVKELKEMGAKRVIFVDKAYDKYTHRPMELSEKEKEELGAEVGFIGSFEKDRAEQMLFLAQNGIKVRIFGNGWEKWQGKHSNLDIKGRPVYGDDYAKAICATKINLCFLRKANRDLQTDRTMEIPACGAFMLAERTKEHQGLFKEGEEAEFFDSKKELLEKVKYYLNHERERENIAKAARRRCIEDGYSHHDRLRYMLSKLNK